MPALTYPPLSSMPAFPRTFSAIPEHRRPDRPAPRPLYSTSSFSALPSLDDTSPTRNLPNLPRPSSMRFTSPSTSTSSTHPSASLPHPSHSGLPDTDHSIYNPRTYSSTYAEEGSLYRCPSFSAARRFYDQVPTNESNTASNPRLGPKRSLPPRRPDSPRPLSQRQCALQRLEQTHIWAKVAHDTRDDDEDNLDDDMEDTTGNADGASSILTSDDPSSARVSPTNSGNSASDSSCGHIARMSSTASLTFGGTRWRRRGSSLRMSLARRASVILGREKSNSDCRDGFAEGGRRTSGLLRRRRSVFRRIRGNEDVGQAGDGAKMDGEMEQEKWKQDMKEMDDMLGALGAKQVEDEEYLPISPIHS